MPRTSSPFIAVVLSLGMAAVAAPEPAEAPVEAAVAASAAPAAPAVTDALRPLEQQVQQMLAEARRQQDEQTLLQLRLARAEAAAAWLPWLWLALAGLAVLSLWLGLRVWRLQGQRVAVPAASPAPHEVAPATSRATPPAAGVLSEHGALHPAPALQGAAQPQPTQPSLTVAHPSVVADAPAQETPTLAGRDFSLGTGVPPRPVSAEELLDLEQQAEFFLVLGQPQSAIELLLAHVRSTGGTQAQPYFKLLEIYREQGDEEAYSRTRERFNQRFNAQAPAWGVDLAQGRDLEDYPALLERLQRAWPQPLRALAELEGLLLRRADLEPLDLPAYRELLLLLALVRDLPARALASDAPADMPSAVDLLLPLDETPPPALSSRASGRQAQWAYDSGTSTTLTVHQFDRELAGHSALDLDLSEPPPAPRDFTGLDMAEGFARPSQRAAFDDSDLLPPPAALDSRR